MGCIPNAGVLAFILAVDGSRLTVTNILFVPFRPSTLLNRHPCRFTSQTLSRLRGRSYVSTPV